MCRRTLLAVVTATILMGSLWVGQAIAQAPPDRPGRGERNPEEMRQRMEQFRQRMDQQMRERLGATEEEWKVLQPRIEKVQQLQRQGRGGFRGFGGRGGRGGRGGQAPQPGGAPEREQSEVEKKTEALRSLLDDESSQAASIKAALGALRAARENAQKELAVARKELQAVITMRQEAQMVLMGLLE